jgi:hypothetical protein
MLRFGLQWPVLLPLRCMFQCLPASAGHAVQLAVLSLSHLLWSFELPIMYVFTLRACFRCCCCRSLQSYLHKYDCLSRLKPGGVLVLNATWKSAREMEAALPGKVRRQLAALAPQMYVVDARAVADAVGLGKRINMVMQTGEAQCATVRASRRQVKP